MGIFDRLFARNGKNNSKAIKPEQYIELENFMLALEKKLKSYCYLAKSDYSALINHYQKVYEYFNALKTSGVLSIYIKKNKLDKDLVSNFLSAYLDIENIIKKHNEEYIDTALVKEKKYLDEVLYDIDKNISLDDDQRKAVLTDEDNCLIIAGAGAGKTTTVAAKVKYLVERKNINPKQILVISFTNKAVGELKERINNNLRIDCPITTFHSTGNAILRKQSDEKLNIKEEGFLFNAINDYLKSKLLDKKAVDNLIMFFGSYFDAPYEGNDLNEYFNSIIRSDFSTLRSNINDYTRTVINAREKKKITISYEVLKSIEEVQIANFLYLNGINYTYESVYPYNITYARKPYTPDFLITQGEKSVYLEHFGISDEGKHTRYSDSDLVKYKKAINDKITIHKKHNTKLIYTFSSYKDGKKTLDVLAEKLEEFGFVLNPRSTEEVYQKIILTEENKYISKLSALVCRFIGNFKTNGYTEDAFYSMIRQNPNVRTKLFLEIAKECYLFYQRRLSQANAVDFQDMINESARALREYKELKNKLEFKYIIVDEYQDISRQRFDLTKELSNVTGAKVIAVGDDWQAIYAFSGSDVTLFTKFCEKMGHGVELKIVNTYRNAQEVIDIAGNFVQKNATQIKKTLKSPKNIEDPVIIYSYDGAPKKTGLDDSRGALKMMAIALETAIGKIVEYSKKEPSSKHLDVALLGRFNFDGKNLERSDLFEFRDYGSKVICKKYPQVNIQFSTAHSSKGLGYDNVIIINASNGVYGFPSKIEDDPVLKLVTFDDKSIEHAEERRLFYVAMTRTKNRVFMIVPQEKPSEFVMELKKDYKNIVLIGDELSESPTRIIANKLCPICGYPLQFKMNVSYGLKLYMCTNEPEVCNYITNNIQGGKMSIQKCTQCQDGYLVVKTNKDGGTFLGCTNYKTDRTGCSNTVSQEEYNSKYFGEEPEVCEEIFIKNIVVNTDNESQENETHASFVETTPLSHEKSESAIIEETIIKNEATEPTIKEIDLHEQEQGSEMQNAGEKWSVKEETDLKINYMKGKSVTQLSIIHGRTKGGIRARLEKLGFAEERKHITEFFTELVSGKENGKEAQIKDQNESADLDGFELIFDEAGRTVTDIELLKRLRAARNQIAKELNVSAFIIATNKVLVRLATYFPRNKEEFLKIKGIEENSFKVIGDLFLKIINSTK